MIEKTCQSLSKSNDIKFILKKIVNFVKNLEIISKEVFYKTFLKEISNTFAH